jgi:hypothetical protein
MFSPYYNPYEYLNGSSLNNGFVAVSGTVTQIMQSVGIYDGFVRADVLTFSSSGLNLTVSMPAPFLAVLGGVPVAANGTTNGVTNNSTTVSFSGVVPASGSQPIYLVATSGTVQNSSIAIPGPPPGHPDYNPNYQPTFGYVQQNTTIILAASASSPPSGYLQLATSTLAAGATGLGSFSTEFAQPFALRTVRAPNAGLLSSATGIFASAGVGYVFNTSGNTFTLPSALLPGGGHFFPTLNSPTVGTMTVNTNGTDLIYGAYFQAVGSGNTSIALTSEQTASLWSVGGTWQFDGGNVTQRFVPVSGNPNGQLPGLAHVTGGPPPDIAYDYVNNIYYNCTASGNATTATWGILNYNASQAGRFLGVQLINATGGFTYTVPASATKAFVEIVAGGGVGGSTLTTASGQFLAAPGGGAACYAKGWISVSGLTTVTGYIGAGGVTPGSSGGASSFGSFFYVPGGSPGSNIIGGAASTAYSLPTQGGPTTYGVGATGVSGLVALGGLSGGMGFALSLPAPVVIGGAGGSTLLGVGGGSFVGQGTSSGGVAQGYGAGGGGAASYSQGSASVTVSGGPGTPGCIIITAYS